MSLKDKIREHTKKKPGKFARARGGGDAEIVVRAKKLGQILKSSHLEAAVKVWIDGLSATKDVYDKITRTWAKEPDWKERRESANMIVAYMEGRPIERQMVLGAHFDDFPAMVAKLRNSPEALRALQSMVGSDELPAIQEKGS